MSALPSKLEEIDSLEVLVIVDNELDPISKYVPSVIAVGNLGHVGMASPHIPTDRGEGVRELRMNQVCCGAHGLSLMVVCVVSLFRRFR
jgi:7,8-dihydropterin-6-yl-methyl-4-(beta-D-ribofuranosyl)aminobenzene 5'-phosphate synthase